jgi:hypothetical protein
VALPHFSTLKPPVVSFAGASLLVNEKEETFHSSRREEKLLEKIIYESVMSEE